jgi:hypothetical protein
MTDRGEVNAGIDAKLKRMYDRRDAMRTVSKSALLSKMALIRPTAWT